MAHDVPHPSITANPSLTVPGIVDLSPETFVTLADILDRFSRVYFDPSNTADSNSKMYLFTLLFAVRSLRTNLADLAKWQMDACVESGLGDSSGMWQCVAHFNLE